MFDIASFTRAVRRGGEALDAAILRSKDSGIGLKVTEVAQFRRGELGNQSVTEVLPRHILAHGAVGESASDATAHFQDHGLDVNLLKEVGENLPPDGAALVIMIEESWLKDLTGMLSGYSDFERFVMRPEPTIDQAVDESSKAG